ncbi:hypothetical protein Fmac_001629 [Flemingia macrophylla]|uniref:Uncharacterized protein n=1 Tax=Flemingia macrophylla TaxID=520843 RepID=A0ABD1NHQ0_9FABA
MVQFSFLRFLVLCYSLLPLLAEDEKKFPWKCPTTFQCGKFGELQFPFTNTSNLGCGLPIMHCGDGNQFKTVHSPKTIYRLESIDGINSVSVTDHRLKKMLKYRNCTAFTYDLKAALPPNSSMLSFQIEMKNNITLLRCKHALANSTKYIYHISCNDSEIYYPSQNFETGKDNMVENECSTLELPISSSPPVDNSTDIYTFLHAEFRMLISVSDNCLKCQENGTQCDVHNFHCTSSKEGADPRRSKLAVDIILKTGIIYMF